MTAGGKRIALLGSTGSIGVQSLEVMESLEGFSVCALGAGSNWKLLAKQSHQWKPKWVALARSQDAAHLEKQLPPGTKLFAGPDAMCELVRHSKAEMVLNGMVGAAGLPPTMEAIRSGSDLAIANKETLVLAGAIIMPAAKKAGIRVLPVDSEHSAIFQCLCSGRRDEVARVVITASGGALRDFDEQAAARATVDEALKHPTWNMGRKITIDSATLMNKALEMIEAHWLFDLPSESIDVVLHGESIVHSYVEFCDGSVIAQMARPDMKMPIAYALAWPRRPQLPVPPLDLPALKHLTFRALPPRFARTVRLGHEVIRRGNVAGAVLNSANETAVEAFLDRRISFGEIVPLVEDALAAATDAPAVTLEALLAADAGARRHVQHLLRSKSV